MSPRFHLTSSWFTRWFSFPNPSPTGFQIVSAAGQVGQVSFRSSALHGLASQWNRGSLTSSPPMGSQSWRIELQIYKKAWVKSLWRWVKKLFKNNDPLQSDRKMWFKSTICLLFIDHLRSTPGAASVSFKCDMNVWLENPMTGFAIISWNNPKKLEKPWITKGQYLAIFRVDFIMYRNKVLMVDTAWAWHDLKAVGRFNGKLMDARHEYRYACMVRGWMKKTSWTRYVLAKWQHVNSSQVPMIQVKRVSGHFWTTFKWGSSLRFIVTTHKHCASGKTIGYLSDTTSCIPRGCHWPSDSLNWLNG